MKNATYIIYTEEFLLYIYKILLEHLTQNLGHERQMFRQQMKNYSLKVVNARKKVSKNSVY